MPISASIVTVGDPYVSETAKDEAGDILAATCSKLGWNIVKRETMGDDEEQLVAWLAGEADSGAVDVVLTVDGIGVSARERVPEAMYRVCEKWLPGVAELIRARGYEKSPFLAMTRGVAGIRGRTILVNMPGGSPTAIKDALEVLKPILRQAMESVKAT
jgi:molybdenum cofactor synthesis domain-containing protein